MDVMSAQNTSNYSTTDPLHNRFQKKFWYYCLHLQFLFSFENGAQGGKRNIAESKLFYIFKGRPTKGLELQKSFTQNEYLKYFSFLGFCWAIGVQRRSDIQILRYEVMERMQNRIPIIHPSGRVIIHLASMWFRYISIMRLKAKVQQRRYFVSGVIDNRGRPLYRYYTYPHCFYFNSQTDSQIFLYIFGILLG